MILFWHTVSFWIQKTASELPEPTFHLHTVQKYPKIIPAPPKRELLGQESGGGAPQVWAHVVFSPEFRESDFATRPCGVKSQRDRQHSTPRWGRPMFIRCDEETPHI